MRRIPWSLLVLSALMAGHLSSLQACPGHAEDGGTFPDHTVPRVNPPGQCGQNSNTSADTGDHKDTGSGRKDPCPPNMNASYAMNDMEFNVAQDTGDPVELSGGVLTLQRTDLRVPSRGMDWEFTRRYGSRINYKFGRIGFNWDFNYHARLIVDRTTGSFTLEDGNIEQGSFIRGSGTSYTTGAGYYTRVTLIEGDPKGYSAGPLEIELANRHGLRTRYRVEGPQGAPIPGIPASPFTASPSSGPSPSTDLAPAVPVPGDLAPSGPVPGVPVPNAPAPGVPTIPAPLTTILPLTKTIDRNGNTMQYLHEHPTDKRRLTAVLDTLGRRYEYLYDGTARLERVRDFMGREIVLGYDVNGDLAEVRSPVVTGTPHGNDFPDGKTEKYVYSSGFSDPKLNHNLLAVISPNEYPSGPESLRVEYYESVGNFDFDRVKDQVLGGTNASGIPAGGTIHYAYEEVSGPYGAVEKTTVTDRNGNVTEYFHDATNHLVAKREMTRGYHPGEPAYYETRYEFNGQGELLRTTFPEGNTSEYSYYAGADRGQQGNLLTTTRLPGPRGGDQASIGTGHTYEPIYNQVLTLTDVHGHVTTHVFDYQEGDGVQNLAFLAASTGRSVAGITALLDAAGMAYNLPDQNGDGVTNDPDNVHGNILRTDLPTVTLLAGGPQALDEGDAKQQRVETTIYNRFGQPTSGIDREENLAQYEYFPENDPDGDGQDLIALNGAGQPSDTVTGGYLRRVIRDSDAPIDRPVSSDIGRNTHQDPPFTTLKTDFTCDRAGNVTSVLDGRGVKTVLFVNQLNQVVQVARASDVSGVAARAGGVDGEVENAAFFQAFAYLERIHFDANNNVTRREIDNRDGTNPDGTPYTGFIQTDYAYDILDQRVTESQEAEEGQPPLVTQVRYDPNQNRLRTTFPEGNIFSWTHDERDLPLTATRGLGSGATESTVTYDLYDGNGNLLKLRDAEDHNGDMLGDPVTRTYDGYDRVVTVRDAVGSVTERHYDEHGNPVLEKRFGQVGGPSPLDDSGAGNVLLSQTEMSYDEADRLVQADRVLFVSAGVDPTRPVTLQDGPLTPGDLKVSTRFDYDRLGRLRYRTEDDLDRHRADYDGVSRVLKATDAADNLVENGFDDNGNLVRVRRTERHPEGRVAEQVFVTVTRYDALNRPLRAVTNLGHTHRMAYDSRDNLTVLTDAQSPPGTETEFTTALVTLNLPGNRTEQRYDGINRLRKTLRTLTADGQGNGMPVGTITTQQGFDGNSRLTSQTDDRGKVTTYEYDALNRKNKEIYADTRFVEMAFDRDDNVRTLTDPNGTVRTCTHDAVNRLIQCSVARGPDVVGTTLQAFQYDGLSRSTKSTDNNEPGIATDDTEVVCLYDALSRKLEEHQKLDADDRILSWDWQDDDLRKALIYPNDRKVSTTWDGQDRLKTVANTSGGPVSGPLCGYEYLGNRLLNRANAANGVLLTMANDAGNQATGYDGDKRLVEMRHKLGGNVQTAFNYTHDRMDNRLTEQRQHNAQTSESWAYDSVYRLTVQKRDIPHGGGIPGEERTWTLDGAQNWASLSISVNGGIPTVLSQTMNDLESYTSFGKVPQVDDLNGNRVDDGEFLYRWDFLNRLREVYRKKSKALLTTCAYDALGAQGHLNGSGRRIRKAVTNSGVQDEDVRFLWDGRTLIQEQDAVSGMLIRQHVQAGLGSPLELDLDTNGDGILDQALFRQENAMGWAEALADVSGVVLERYSYDAYGAPTFLDASGNPLPDQTRSALGNNLLWGGGYRDNLTKTQSMGHRTYSERQGRFLSRDPLGLWGDGVGWGNGYAYVGNQGVMGWDPEGLAEVGKYDIFRDSYYRIPVNTGSPLADALLQPFSDVFVGASDLSATALNLASNALGYTNQFADEALWAAGIDPEAANFAVGVIGMERLLLRSSLSFGSSARAVTTKTPQAVFQNVVTKANQGLAANPQLAQAFLKKLEYGAYRASERTFGLNYGKALERMVARDIAEDPCFEGLFKYVGGPRNPDFIGLGAFEGLKFDVTTATRRSLTEHTLRPYGRGLIFGTYNRPSFRLEYP